MAGTEFQMQTPRVFNTVRESSALLGSKLLLFFPFPANARSGLLERHSQSLLDICHFRPLLDDLLLFGFFSNVTDAPAAIRQHFQKAGM